jgi:hypothetical protein
MTSDQFFEKLASNELDISSTFKWDIIFIDGDHHHSTIDRDIINCFNHLSKNGTIIMHDCLYGDDTITHSNPKGTDVWRSWVKLRCTRPDLTMNVVNIDWGVGIIQKGKQQIWNKAPLKECLTAEYFTGCNSDKYNILSSYDLYQNGQFLTQNGDKKIVTYIDSVDENLTRTHLLPLITIDQFYEIYE